MTPEPRFPSSTVLTCRDAHAIFAVMQAAASGHRRGMPPGVNSVDDLAAVMRGGVAFFMAYKPGAAKCAPEPTGAIGYRWERGSLRVFHVAVLPGYQRAGVARRLLKAVETVGLALGSTIVTLSVGEEAAHHRLFERAGYNAAGTNGVGRFQFRKAFGERAV